jgi:hypothetical protein
MASMRIDDVAAALVPAAPVVAVVVVVDAVELAVGDSPSVAPAAETPPTGVLARWGDEVEPPPPWPVGCCCVM